MLSSNKDVNTLILSFLNHREKAILRLVSRPIKSWVDANYVQELKSLTSFQNPALSPALQIADIELMKKKSNDWLERESVGSAYAQLIVSTPSLFARVKNKDKAIAAANNAGKFTVRVAESPESKSHKEKLTSCTII